MNAGSPLAASTEGAAVPPHPLIHWQENGFARQARWRAESGGAPPRRVLVADDTLSADAAYRLACEGTGLLWQGDFHNARQLLQALERRVQRQPRRGGARVHASITEAFHAHRMAQAQRARILGQVLLPMDAAYRVPLRRAPDVQQACAQVWGAAAADEGESVLALRELLGLVGAYEWRRKGVPMAALREGARIHPHYGVFSPVRGEYVDLVAQAPLPPGAQALAMDVGTGTGVLSAVLAQRGVARVLATDLDPRALACAADNLARLGLQDQVSLLQTDLFAPGAAPLVLCNPPWVPGRAATPIERAVYDEGSRMLRGFLQGLAVHLTPQGEGWLILSDLAEHLGLRSRQELLGWIDAAGLCVLGRLDTRPRHPKVHDASDPLHAARAAEVTSLWRLGRLRRVCTADAAVQILGA